ncbi:thermonuclease family protein [Caenimonas sedimenti]|uniref:Thermonuclease family protein n=1 Tax=Caenimonas sedimenti TaxID=2596921 RepID=A0A562ZL30_9BURK|nr:thermonuclease family protein [Caenimonas sedimenti]TWO69131.1 thermonuclease family protein [Caenimonas sedimenti]
MTARILLAALLSIASATADADASGLVVGVSDGDTLTVLEADHSQRRIRLAGIDAPEKSQAFGDRSKRALSDCAFGRQAVLVGSKVDRYGRLVAKVVVGGVDCNLRQVALGLAWHYKDYEREQLAEDRAAYATAESEARDRRSGLWRDDEPLAPWAYRRDRR